MTPNFRFDSLDPADKAVQAVLQEKLPEIAAVLKDHPCSLIKVRHGVGPRFLLTFVGVPGEASPYFDRLFDDETACKVVDGKPSDWGLDAFYVRERDDA